MHVYEWVLRMRMRIPTFSIAQGSDLQCRRMINALGVSFTWRTESHFLYIYYTSMHERIRIYGYTHTDKNRMPQTQTYLHDVYAYVHMDS